MKFNFFYSALKGKLTVQQLEYIFNVFLPFYLKTRQSLTTLAKMVRRETRSKTVAASTTETKVEITGNTLKKNLSKKKTTKIAAKNEEEINKENTPDHSVLQLPINLGTDNVRQILNIIKGGTTEIKDLVLNECTIIVECLECRNLFRSLANFVSHKGNYCKTHHCEKMLLFQSNSYYQNEVVEPVMQRDNDDEHSADLHPNSTQPSEVFQSDTANIARQSSENVNQVTVNCKYLLPTASGKRKEPEVPSHISSLPKKRKNLHAIVNELNFKATISHTDIQPLDSSTEVIKTEEVVSVEVASNDCDINVSKDEVASSTTSNCENLFLLLDQTPGNAFYIENLSTIKKEFERDLQIGKPKRNMSHFICPICGPPSMWGNFKRHLVDNNHLSEEEANLWLYYKLKYKSPKEAKIEESSSKSQETEEVKAASLSNSCPEIDADKDSGLGRCSPEMNEASSASGSCKSSSLTTEAIASNHKQADTKLDVKSTFATPLCNQQQQFHSKRASSRIKRKKCLYNTHDCPNASCLKHSKSIHMEKSPATMANTLTNDLSKTSTPLLQKSSSNFSTSFTGSSKSLDLDINSLSIGSSKATGEVDTKEHLLSESHSSDSISSAASDVHPDRPHGKKSKCEKESNSVVLSANSPAEPSSSTSSNTSESNNVSSEDYTKTNKLVVYLQIYNLMYFCLFLGNTTGSTNAPLKIHLRNISYGSYAII